MSSPPAPAVHIDVALIRRLLADHVPDLADLPLRMLDEGWDHVMVVLGEAWVLRLPRRELGAGMIEGEQQFLDDVGPSLPIPVPIPVHRGRPTSYYPYRWSVVPWRDGAVAATEPSLDHAGAALDLGRFLTALHRPAPAGAPHNPHRGVPLATWRPRITERLERVRALDDARLPADALSAVVDDAIAAPPWSGPPVWVHGDLHPGNVLVHQRRITSIIDWSDVHGGDPAVDAIIAWFLLPTAHRAAFRSAAPVLQDEGTWTRGRGWAVHLALVVHLHGHDGGNPWYGRMGRRALAAVLDG